MKYQIILYFFVTFTFEIFCKDLRILGGTAAKLTEFPYFVSLRFMSMNRLFCGGVIISERHILTAAHCLFAHRDIYDFIRIYTVITSPQTIDGPIYKIDKVTCHPNFTGEVSLEYMNVDDIAVIKTAEEIKFNEFQNKVALPTERTKDLVECTMCGWGTISFPDIVFPNYLQKADMRIAPKNVCLSFFPFKLKDGQICAHNVKGVGQCKGDSGGPLVYNNTLVGIISSSVPCAKGVPEIFTDVYYYLDFIRKSMRD